MKMPDLKAVQEYIMRMSKMERAIFYGATLLVSLALLDRLIISPVSSKIEGLNESIRATESNIRKNARILSLRDRILAESAKYNAYSRVSGSDEEEMTALLKELEQAANKNSIYLVDIKPAGIKGADTSKKYTVNLNCEGKMEQIADFMISIEESKKLLTVEKYQISPKAKESSVAKCNMSVSEVIVP